MENLAEAKSAVKTKSAKGETPLPPVAFEVDRL
jgi:hypothetical protein